MLKHVYKHDLGKNLYLEPSDERIHEEDALYCALCGYRVEIEDGEEGRYFEHVPENESCPDVEDSDNTTIKDELPIIQIENSSLYHARTGDHVLQDSDDADEKVEDADESTLQLESRTEENVIAILSALTPESDTQLKKLNSLDTNSDFLNDIAELESRKTQPITRERAREYIEAASVALKQKRLKEGVITATKENHLLDNVDTIAEIKTPALMKKEFADQANGDSLHNNHIIAIVIFCFLIVVCATILLYLLINGETDPVVRKVFQTEDVSSSQLENLDSTDSIVTDVTEKQTEPNNDSKVQVVPQQAEIKKENSLEEGERREIINADEERSDSLTAQQDSAFAGNQEQTSTDVQNEASVDTPNAATNDLPNENAANSDSEQPKVNCVKITSSSVNLREHPDPSSKVLAVLSEDSEIVCSEDYASESNWVKVSYNNQTGYICECSTDHISALPSKGVALVKLAPRELPRSTAKLSYGFVDEGKTVQIVGESNCWYKIRAKNDCKRSTCHPGGHLSGYVNKCYVKPL